MNTLIVSLNFIVAICLSLNVSAADETYKFHQHKSYALFERNYEVHAPDFMPKDLQKDSLLTSFDVFDKNHDVKQFILNIDQAVSDRVILKRHAYYAKVFIASTMEDRNCEDFLAIKENVLQFSDEQEFNDRLQEIADTQFALSLGIGDDGSSSDDESHSDQSDGSEDEEYRRALKQSRREAEERIASERYYRKLKEEKESEKIRRDEEWRAEIEITAKAVREKYEGTLVEVDKESIKTNVALVEQLSNAINAFMDEHPNYPFRLISFWAGQTCFSIGGRNYVLDDEMSATLVEDVLEKRYQDLWTHVYYSEPMISTEQSKRLFPKYRDKKYRFGAVLRAVSKEEFYDVIWYHINLEIKPK